MYEGVQSISKGEIMNHNVNAINNGQYKNSFNKPVQKPMPVVRSNVKIRGNFKQKAYELGKFNRVVLPKRMPSDFGRGEIVEIVMMAMIGRVSLFYESYYNEIIDVSFDYWDDITKKIDMRINGHTIDLKSKFTHDSTLYADTTPPAGIKQVLVHYDYPGIQNLLHLLRAIEMIRPLPNQLIKDINYLWELYMSFSVMRDEEIYYKHGMHEELDDLMLYVDEFPELKAYPNYRNIAYMYVEDPNEGGYDNNYCINNEFVPEVVVQPQLPTPEELEAQKKYFEQKTRLENHVTQKGIDGGNLFHKFKLDPYKSFSIDNEEVFLTLLKDLFPEIANKLEYYTFVKLPKGGEFRLSYGALHAKVATMFQTPEEINQGISIEWIDENIYKGFLGEHFKQSLYQFIKFINPDTIKWEIAKLPIEEYKDADRKLMIDVFIDQLGLNASVMKLLQPSSLNGERLGTILCNHYGELELFEIIKKRVLDIKK